MGDRSNFRYGNSDALRSPRNFRFPGFRRIGRLDLFREIGCSDTTSRLDRPTGYTGVPMTIHGARSTNFPSLFQCFLIEICSCTLGDGARLWCDALHMLSVIVKLKLLAGPDYVRNSERSARTSTDFRKRRNGEGQITTLSSPPRLPHLHRNAVCSPDFYTHAA
jgi:hypothetical protein